MFWRTKWSKSRLGSTYRAAATPLGNHGRLAAACGHALLLLRVAAVGLSVMVGEAFVAAIATHGLLDPAFGAIGAAIGSMFREVV